MLKMPHAMFEQVASTGKHCASTFQELRRTFDIGDNLPDVELLSFVSAKTLKIYSTYEALKSRIQTLLMRYKKVVDDNLFDPKTDEIKSKGFHPIIEFRYL